MLPRMSAGLAALVLLAVPATATASGSAGVSGGVLTITGDGGDNTLYVTDEGAELRVSTDGTTTDTGGCPFVNGSARCSKAQGITRIVINAGPGDDLAYAGDVFVPMELNGEGGRDDLRGGDVNDAINGGPGNDTQLLGDKGDDVIDGGEGDDERLLGDAYVTAIGELGADVVRGGPGVDTLHEERNYDRAQFWSLDGVANDGADRDDNLANGAEEGDNILPDVENVTTGFDDDTIIGSAANNKLRGGTLGNDRLVGGEGDDDLFTGITGDLDAADGGPGNDKVQGNGTLLGGPGNDAVRGQSGNDALDGGPGVDTIEAGDGNDVVRAADGEIDQVGCGVGADVAQVDQADTVNADPGSICETLTRVAPAGGGGAVGGGTPGGGPAGGGGGQNPTGNPNATAVQLILGSAKLTATGARLPVTLPGPGQLTVQLTIPRTTARRMGLRVAAAKTVTIGTGRVRATAAGRKTVRVTYAKRYRAKLRRAKRLAVTVKTTFLSATSDDPVRATRRVTLRR